MIEVRQLRHFIAVVEEGGFRSAARKIHLSAPALTRSLNLLEDFYGVALLKRSRTSVTPTALGKQFLRHARMVVNELDAIPDHLGKMAGFAVGRLRVGVSPVVMDCCMRAVVTRMRREHPGLKLSIVVDQAVPLLDAMERRELDLIMCVPRPAELRGNLEVQPLYAELAFWWVRAGHPLANSDPAPLKAFADYPYCSQKLPPTYSEWMEDLAIAVRHETGVSIDTSPALECSDYGLLISTVLETDSMALIPVRCAVADGRSSQLERLRFPQRPGPFPPVGMSAAYPSSMPPPPAASLLIDLVREQVGKIDAQMDPTLLGELSAPVTV